jgi:cytochrome c556
MICDLPANKERSMKPLFCVGSLLAMTAFACLAAGSAGASDDDEETPSIKTVMEKLHKGKDSPLNTLKAALKAGSPDWESVQKEAKLFKKYGDALPKNDPPKGKKASFEKLAKAYAANAKSLEEAAEKENLKGTRDAMKKISSSCTACHKSHRRN